MAKLYYGNGEVTIEGSGIRGVEIRYSGAIEIDKTCGDNFGISTQGNGILIFPLGKGILKKLFCYEGEFKIISVMAADDNAIVSTTIHRVMDYSELLNSNAEDLTVKSENLSSAHIVGKKFTTTSLKQKTIPNLNTSNHDGMLCLEDGTEYKGYYHVHLKDNAAMTGKDHTEDSQVLYIKQKKGERIIKKLVSTRNLKLVPLGSRLTKRVGRKTTRIMGGSRKGGY